MSRPLRLCDLDFTDLLTEDDKDDLTPRGLGGVVPPPPPPMGMRPPPPVNGPPPPMNLMAPQPNLLRNSPPKYGNAVNGNGSSMVDGQGTIKKNKKTVSSLFCLFFFKSNSVNHSSMQVKLFWKEVRDDTVPIAVGKTIWDELPDATVDVEKLEHLFESRAKDLISKVSHCQNNTHLNT